MTVEPGFAALETTIATALAPFFRSEHDPEWLSVMARVVCEAIVARSRIDNELDYGETITKLPVLVFPLAEPRCHCAEYVATGACVRTRFEDKGGDWPMLARQWLVPDPGSAATHKEPS